MKICFLIILSLEISIISNSYAQYTPCFECRDDKNCKRPEKFDDKCVIMEGESIKTAKCNQTDDEKNNCFTYRSPDNTVTRGCAYDKPTNPKIGQLKLCKDAHCNSECTAEINCPQCNETEDPDCGKLDRKDDWLKGKCPTYNSVCYRCEDNDGKTHRGCGGELNSMNCKVCYDDKCYAEKPLRTCLTCDGKNDENCHVEASYVQTAECEANIEGCLIKITDEGYTERRCIKPNESCPEKSETCKICSDKNNCNVGILPPNRRLCYQCENCDNLENLKLCRRFKENDSCYTYAKDGTSRTMTRGCLSDLETDPNRKACKEAGEKCIICDNDSCNHYPFESSKLLCIKCSSEKNANCILQQDKSEVKNCDASEYWKKEKCFTFTNGSDATKGCILEHEDLKCDSDKNCKACETDGCNNVGITKFSCYQCRSDLQKECSEDNLTALIRPSECHNGDNLGCYTEIWKKYVGQNFIENVVSRGCIADKLPITCLNETTCYQCKDINCNNGKAPKFSSAVSIRISGAMIVASVLGLSLVWRIYF